MFFGKDVSDMRESLEENGYVLLRGAAAPELVAALQSFYEGCEAGEQADLSSGFVKGKKRQYLFDFADAQSRENFRDQICALVGYRTGSLTISERHIKAYSEYAADYPAPHKDRAASEYSIGIPVQLGAQSRVCMFPQLDRQANLHESAYFLPDVTSEDIEALYAEEATVHLQAGVGDILVFEGSAMFHERLKPAGSVLLYIKINDQGLDPLGENVFAEALA